LDSNLLALGSFITSLGTLIVAVFALHSWKKQFNKSLQRDFVLDALDTIHAVSALNFKIVDKFNAETEKDNNFLLMSEYYLNPIPANYPNLLESLGHSMINLDKVLNRLSKIQNDEYFDMLSEKYIEIISEIYMFFESDELIGFDHPDIIKISEKGWTTSWLDKAFDKKRVLAFQIEEYLLKLLKI